MKRRNVSATALLIAKAQIFLSQDEKTKGLVPEQAVQPSLWFIERCTGRSAYGKTVRNPVYRIFLRMLERITVPGLLVHYGARKRYIEQAARSALSGEIAAKQVVVLAGGFDTLALRLHAEHPDVRFFELDHPATQSVKRAVLSERNLAGPNYRLLPIDFSAQELADVLNEKAGFSSAAPTVFIAEGIVMYLTRDEVDRLFASVRALGAPGSRFIFTYMDSLENANGKVAAGLTDLWLKLKREPYRWSIAADRLEDFLAGQGMRLEHDVQYSALQKDFCDEEKQRLLSRVRGENVCVARLG